MNVYYLSDTDLLPLSFISILLLRPSNANHRLFFFLCAIYPFITYTTSPSILTYDLFLISIFADAGPYISAPVFKSAASAAAAELLLKKQKEGVSYFGDSAEKPMTLDDVYFCECIFMMYN